MEPIGTHLLVAQITPSVAAMAAAGSANNDGAQISNSANTICCHYKAPGAMITPIKSAQAASVLLPGIQPHLDLSDH